MYNLTIFTEDFTVLQLLHFSCSANHFGSKFWIGLNANTKSDCEASKFVWYNKMPVNFTYWKHGERCQIPDHVPYGCGCSIKKTTKWKLCKCYAIHGALCEKPLSKTSKSVKNRSIDNMYWQIINKEYIIH